MKQLQETKFLLHKERLKEKLGKQEFHYEMDEIFKPVTFKQELSEKQRQALRDSTRAVSQTTVQAKENQTQAIQESSNTLQKSIKEGIQDYDEIKNRNIQLLTSFVNSNQVDSSIKSMVLLTK